MGTNHSVNKRLMRDNQDYIKINDSIIDKI